MVNRRSAGYTLLEVVVAMVIFGIFLMIVTILTAEMRAQEKRFPVSFMRNPQVVSVLARLRRDVLDAPAMVNNDEPYEVEIPGFTQEPKVLLIKTFVDGSFQNVVWDFREEGLAKRISFRVGVRSEWIARGLPPEFSTGLQVNAIDMKNRPWGVRLKAFDKKGNLALDQLYQPRGHK